MIHSGIYRRGMARNPVCEDSADAKLCLSLVRYAEGESKIP